jgi:hypothetical protein
MVASVGMVDVSNRKKPWIMRYVDELKVLRWRMPMVSLVLSASEVVGGWAGPS